MSNTPDPLHGRRLDRLDEGGEGHILARAPGMLQYRRDEDVFAAAQRVSLDRDQSQQTRGCACDPFSQGLAVRQILLRRRRKRRRDRDRQPCAAAGRVDDKLRRRSEPLNPAAILVPFRQPLAPALRFSHGELVG